MSERVLWLSRVTSDVLDHLFVVVCGCGPHDNLGHKSYAICIVCQGGISEGVSVCVLWLSRVTSDVLDRLFVVVFRCGPHDKLKS